ncbi:MAG: DNA-binding protein [Candidatus Entotheonellia bacterium]
MVRILTVSYGWTPWKIYFKIPIRPQRAMDSVHRWIETKGRPAQRVERPWKGKLSEIDAWVHAGGAAQDDVDEGKEND